MLMAIILIAWFAIGYAAMLVFCAEVSGEVTGGDLLFCIIGGIGMPVSVFACLCNRLCKVVIWRRKC